MGGKWHSCNCYLFRGRGKTLIPSLGNDDADFTQRRYKIGGLITPYPRTSFTDTYNALPLIQPYANVSFSEPVSIRYAVQLSMINDVNS